MATERDFERVQIRKRKGGRWYVRFREGGKRTEACLQVSNKVRAIERAGEIDKDLRDGKPWQWRLGRTRPGELTFREVVAEFLEKYTKWSETTRRQNAGTVTMLERQFGGKPVSQVDVRQIEDYLARRRDEGLSVASHNRYLCVLKVVLGKAMEWGHVRENAAAQVKCIPEDQKAPRPYHDDELERLLPALRTDHRDIVVVYSETGLRKSELMKLKWADVDMGAGTLTVRQPKNGRDRTIPMSTNVKRILQARRKEWEASPVVDIEGTVYGSRADIRQALRRAFVPAQITSERGKVLRPIHSLRDTCITRLVAAGVPLDRVQVLAGHNSVEMTRRYALTREASLREAVTKVFG